MEGAGPLVKLGCHILYNSIVVAEMTCDTVTATKALQLSSVHLATPKYVGLSLTQFERTARCTVYLCTVSVSLTNESERI